jgi:hypothetical protein
MPTDVGTIRAGGEGGGREGGREVGRGGTGKSDHGRSTHVARSLGLLCGHVTKWKGRHWRAVRLRGGGGGGGGRGGRREA